MIISLYKGSKLFFQVISNSESIGNNRQCGVDSRYRWKKTPIDNIQIMDIVSPAIFIEDRSFGILSKFTSAHLVCDPC